MGPSLEALQVLALEALQVLEVEERQEAGVLLLEGGVKFSCLLRQPRYQAQEVRVPFERIGGAWPLLMPGRRGVRGPSQVLWPP